MPKRLRSNRKKQQPSEFTVVRSDMDLPSQKLRKEDTHPPAAKPLVYAYIVFIIIDADGLVYGFAAYGTMKVLAIFAQLIWN
jgi:hypothetical protein